MRLLARVLPCLLAGLFVVGCGKSGFVKAKGRIVKGGQPYITNEGEGLRVFFAPAVAPEGSQYDSYAAEYNPDDGTFQVMGKDGYGLPPGQYRVGLQLMKSKEDLLGGKLLGKKSPFTCDVTSGSNDLVIDLDQANFDSLLVVNAKPRRGR